eukprot:scaffold10745_cov143-Isochrysis_galbana.AAC.1
MQLAWTRDVPARCVCSGQLPKAHRARPGLIAYANLAAVGNHDAEVASEPCVCRAAVRAQMRPPANYREECLSAAGERKIGCQRALADGGCGARAHCTVDFMPRPVAEQWQLLPLTLCHNGVVVSSSATHRCECGATSSRMRFLCREKFLPNGRVRRLKDGNHLESGRIMPRLRRPQVADKARGALMWVLPQPSGHTEPAERQDPASDALGGRTRHLGEQGSERVRPIHQSTMVRWIYLQRLLEGSCCLASPAHLHEYDSDCVLRFGRARLCCSARASEMQCAIVIARTGAR